MRFHWAYHTGVNGKEEKRKHKGAWVDSRSGDDEPIGVHAMSCAPSCASALANVLEVRRLRGPPSSSEVDDGKDVHCHEEGTEKT